MIRAAIEIFQSIKLASLPDTWAEPRWPTEARSDRGHAAGLTSQSLNLRGLERLSRKLEISGQGAGLAPLHIAQHSPTGPAPGHGPSHTENIIVKPQK
jgi:hypothetical protein